MTSFTEFAWDNNITHKIVKLPEAEVYLDDKGVVWVHILLEIEHGRGKSATSCTHAMGFMVPLKSMQIIRSEQDISYAICDEKFLEKLRSNDA